MSRDNAPAFKVAWLRLEEGKAVGRLLGSVGELEGHLLGATHGVGQLQAQDLEQQQTAEPPRSPVARGRGGGC